MTGQTESDASSSAPKQALVSKAQPSRGWSESSAVGELVGPKPRARHAGSPRAAAEDPEFSSGPATMNIAQAAAYMGISKSTLYTWRTRRPGFGPRAVKAGGALRYRRSDLDAWIDGQVEVVDVKPGLNLACGEHESTRGTAVAGAVDSLSRHSGPRRQ